MGWSHIPDVDSALSSAEDNLFAAPKQQPTGKISVNLPTDDWLCHKMDRLNLTLVRLKSQAEELSSTLVNPSLVSVIGVVKDSGVKSSEEVSSTLVGVKAKKMDKSLAPLDRLNLTMVRLKSQF